MTTPVRTEGLAAVTTSRPGPTGVAEEDGGSRVAAVEVVSATRLPAEAFWQRSPLGISLRRLPQEDGVRATIAFENRRALAEIYNPRILDPGSAEHLVFVHDDVWIDDTFFADRIIEGLRSGDVIGIAGNRRRLPNQPGWAFVDTTFTWDADANLAGRIAHASRPFGSISAFGPAPAECELLDGVLLAARRSKLVECGVLFDPQFDFHFYDMDFCREARRHGLRLLTWPLSLTHQSKGTFGTPAWQEKYRQYLEKWGT